jgi:hypothetical protein
VATLCAATFTVIAHCRCRNNKLLLCKDSLGD